MFIDKISSFFCCFPMKDVNKPQPVLKVENPEISHVTYNGPEWRIEVKSVNFDSPSQKLTFGIEHHGPKDAEILFSTHDGAMKSLPAQKTINIQVKKGEGLQVSNGAQTIAVTIDFSDQKYQEFFKWGTLLVRLPGEGNSFLMGSVTKHPSGFFTNYA